MTVPGYWMHEETGILKPVVLAYLEGEQLDRAGLALMRAYLRQWINAPAFIGDEVDALRRTVDSLDSTDRVRAWLELAFDAGVDPL